MVGLLVSELKGTEDSEKTGLKASLSFTGLNNRELLHKSNFQEKLGEK